jgi:hypothetical protein
MFFRVTCPVSNTEVQSGRTTYFVDSVAEIMFYDLHAIQIVKQTWELIAVLGSRSLTTLNWRAWPIPVRFSQCDWTHTLCYLTVVASYLCSARLICEDQHNVDVQQTTCLLHVTLICEPNENISNAFLKRGEEN